jgi:hypothetical protein
VRLGGGRILLAGLAFLSACTEMPAPATDAGSDGDDVRVRYCAVGQACGVIAPRNFSACVSSLDGPPPAVQACIAAAAADCEAARACAWDATHPSVCTFGQKPFCDGNVAYTCDGATTTTAQLDCSLVGETCVAGPTSAQCARGTCNQPGTDSYCAGTVAAYCARPFLLGPDCATLDSTCVGSDGGASCQGNGAPCIVPACSGSTLLDCKDARAAKVPCAADEHCIPAGANVTSAHCGVAADCVPSTYFDRCIDGVLTFCRRGAVTTIDCRALGFADCQGSPASGCVLAAVGDAGSHPLVDMPLP